MSSAICVIANAKSGKGGADRLDDLLAAAPAQFDIRRVKHGRDLEATAAQAVADGYSVVVAAGGDGTVSAVANALVGSRAALGVIPLGTFNYFARSLGLPQTPERAIAALSEGRRVPATLATINGRIFVNNASLGLYPAILQQRERSYRRWGRSRTMALWVPFRTLLGFRRGQRMKITVDGVPVRLKTPSAFIACNPYQLRSVGLEGADAIEDGKLAAIVAPDIGRWRLILNFLRLGLGMAQRGREFDLYTGEEILVEIRRRQKLIAIDGERLRLETPLRLSILHHALTVVIPDPSA